MTLAHQLVGVQAALHQQFALGLVNELDGLGGGCLAVRRVDDLEAADVDAVLGGRILIFAAGPTRIGMMMPASAASTAPRSEVSSQGCATMVVAGGTALRGRDQAVVLAG